MKFALKLTGIPLLVLATACGGASSESSEAEAAVSEAAAETEEAARNAGDAMEDAANSAGEAMEDAARETGEAMDNAMSGMKEAAGDAKDAAGNMMADASAAMDDAASSASAAMSSAAASAEDAVKDATAEWTGDAAAGKRVFVKCMSCHSVKEGQNKVGPSLYGIVGREAGSVPGFKYSKANAESGITWTKDVMFEYLEDPRGYIPGTKMIFPGLKKAEDRKNVIAYLEAEANK